MRIVISAESDRDVERVAALRQGWPSGAEHEAIEIQGVEEFLLVGMRLDRGLMPSHFDLRAGTVDYLIGRLHVLLGRMEKQGGVR